MVEKTIITTNERDHKISDLVSSAYTPARIALIKQMHAKNTTDLEFIEFITICDKYKLDPQAKEIWCYKDGRGGLIIFASRDGFRKKIHEHKRFISLNSLEVCENDKFKMGIKNGKTAIIEHSFGTSDRGKVIGAYAIITLTNGEIIEWADTATYDKKQFTWNSHKVEMIKKVAEAHAIKKICNLGGLYAEGEFKIKDGVVIDSVSSEDKIDNVNAALKEKGSNRGGIETKQDKKPIEDIKIPKIKPEVIKK